MNATSNKKRHRDVARRLLNGFINPPSLDALTALIRVPLIRATAGRGPTPAPVPASKFGPYETRVGRTKRRVRR